MQDAYVIGTFSTPFGKMPDRTFKDLTRDAYLGVLADAGFEDGRAIEFGWFGNCGMAGWGQSSIRGQVCLSPLVAEGLFPERVPVINVEGACATASMAFHGACKDILSGQSHLSVALGVEKLFNPNIDRVTALKGFRNGMDNFDPEQFFAAYEDVGNKIGQPFSPGDDRTLFMDTYAMQACYHMWKYGTTARQIAIAAAKNHCYGAANPLAQYRFHMTAEQVLADRIVSDPLTRSMCAPIGDGASAVLVCSRDFYRSLSPKVRARALRVRASVLTGGKYRNSDEPGLSRVAADKAYAMAGVGPAQMNVGEVHDATSFCEIYQAEMLRLCPDGEGGAFVESGATSPGGRIPLNTSGGLVSKGHPVGATGMAMLHELAVQLRGEAGVRQVPNAEFAIQENGGGVMGLEEAACSVVILQRAEV